MKMPHIPRGKVIGEPDWTPSNKAKHSLQPETNCAQARCSTPPAQPTILHGSGGRRERSESDHSTRQPVDTSGLANFRLHLHFHLAKLAGFLATNWANILDVQSGFGVPCYQQ
jgi:hypothetical protein